MFFYYLYFSLIHPVKKTSKVKYLRYVDVNKSRVRKSLKVMHTLEFRLSISDFRVNISKLVESSRIISKCRLIMPKFLLLYLVEISNY